MRARAYDFISKKKMYSLFVCNFVFCTNVLKLILNEGGSSFFAPGLFKSETDTTFLHNILTMAKIIRKFANLGNISCQIFC